MRAKLKRLLRWTAREWVIVASMQSCIYFILVRQCVSAAAADRQRPGAGKRAPDVQETPASRLLKYTNLARRSYKLKLALYLLSIIKTCAVKLLGLGLLGERPLLDCLLVGRFRYYGRTSDISALLLLIFGGSFLFYRFVMCSLRPNFRFSCVEFMLHSSEQVHSVERASVRARRGEASEPAQEANFGRKDKSAELGLHSCDPVFFLKNPFATSAHDRWILRPNRSLVSHKYLNRFASLMCLQCCAIYLLWFYLTFYLLAGTIMTNLGFELAYPKCVHWLLGLEGPEGEHYRRLIYAPSQAGLHLAWLNKTIARQEMSLDQLPFVLPLIEADQQSVAESWYNFARISGDLGENLFWYYEFLGYYMGLSFLVLVLSIDVARNASKITQILEEILHQLRLVEPRRLSSGDQGAGHLWSSPKLLQGNLEHQEKSEQRFCFNGPKMYQTILADPAERYAEHLRKSSLANKITRAQAMLMDHFILINQYNDYVSFFVSLLLLLVLLYSLAFCAWIVQISSAALESEFIIAELCGILFTSSLLAGVCISRSYTYKMYSLISSIIAHEETRNGQSPNQWPESREHRSTTARWKAIIKHYYPKPMYCFSLLGSVELSWLFMIKVSF